MPSKEPDSVPHGLEDLETILQRSIQYNAKLSSQIDKLKNTIKINKSFLYRLKTNEKAVQTFCAKNPVESSNLMNRIERIEIKLRNSMNTFNIFKKRCQKSTNGSGKSFVKQLDDLGTRLHIIGNEIKQLRQNEVNTERSKSPDTCTPPNYSTSECRTKCKCLGAVMKDTNEARKMLTNATDKKQNAKAVMKSLKKSAEQQRRDDLKTPIRNIKYYSDLEARVKRILKSAESLNVNSARLCHLKMLCNLVLKSIHEAPKCSRCIMQNPASCENGNCKRCDVKLTSYQKPNLSNLCPNPYMKC